MTKQSLGRLPGALVISGAPAFNGAQECRGMDFL
jgi:hypothetical protein